MEISNIIIAIMWFFIALSVGLQYIHYCKDLRPIERVIVFIIFLFGSPFLIIASVLETILGFIFPSGWDDDDQFKS